MITALIVFVAVFLFGLVYAVIRVTDRDEKRDPFAQAALTVTPVEGFADLGPMPDEIAHEEYLTAPPIPGEELPTLPSPTAEFATRNLDPDPVRYGHNLRYRYSDELDGDFPDPPAPPPVPWYAPELADGPALDYAPAESLWNILSPDTIVNGFQAIKDGVK